MPTYSQTNMILWTLLAVFIAGIGVVASVLSPPKSIAQMRVKAIETTAEVVQAADRSPASVAPEFSALAIDDKGTQAVDFTLPCEGQGRFSKNVAQIRLTGRLCDRDGHADHREIASSEIRNTTNGFSATVFYLKVDSFTTDYMTLAAGENHIRILHILKAGGRLERDFVIERR